MAHKVLIQVTLDDSWDEYFQEDRPNLDVDPKLFIEDLFPSERRMDGIETITFVEVKA